MSPTPSFTCFAAPPLPSRCLGQDVLRTSYIIQRLVCVRGPAVAGLAPDQPLWRVERGGAPALPDAPFVGASQHLAYTDSAAREDLTRISAAPSGPQAVLIPIRKSAAWWALAQEERQRHFVRGRQAGHIALGRPFAARIHRRLYHARYLPNSSWDFLTYFEFSDADAGAFRELLATLRDPTQNPEWAFVDRETEIWMLLRPGA